MPQRIAIIGAGITGLSVAQALRDNFTITIFENRAATVSLTRIDAA